jgi:hypothetical protein
MGRLQSFVDRISRTSTVNSSIAVLIGSSAWLGLSIATFAKYLKSGDSFEIAFGLVNLLMSSFWVVLESQILRALIRRQSSPAIRS